MTIGKALRFALPALAIALSAGFGFAQTKPAAAGATAAPVLPTISAAPAQKPISAAHLAAAREVIIASGLSRSFEPVIPELMAQIDMNVIRTRPELTADMKAVLKKLGPGFKAKESQMVENAAQIAAASIDRADLVKIAAFFNSPAGKKYVAAQPIMLQRLVVTTHAWTELMSQHMMASIRAEMRKRGKQL